MAIRSDLDLETTMIGRDDGTYERLFARDAARNLHMRMYFFRGTLRSLYSAHRQLNRLTDQRQVGTEFRELATARGEWDEFVKQRKEVGRSAQRFDKARNSFGAHAEESLEESLTHAPPEQLVGASVVDLRRLGAEWGTEALGAAMSVHAGGNDDVHLRSFIESMRDLTLRAAGCIDFALRIYASKYPVLRGVN